MSTQGFGGWYVVLYDSMQTDSWHYPSIEAAIADSSPILGSREYYCDYLTTHYHILGHRIRHGHK